MSRGALLRQTTTTNRSPDGSYVVAGRNERLPSKQEITGRSFLPDAPSKVKKSPEINVFRSLCCAMLRRGAEGRCNSTLERLQADLGASHPRVISRPRGREDS